MTTLAFDGKYLATDSLTNSDGMRLTTKKNKIIELDSNMLYSPYRRELDVEADALVCIAVAGCCDIITYYLDHIYNNGLLENLDGNALLFTKKHIYRSDGRAFYEIKEDKIALGSGTPFALTALRLGKSAKEAVELAIKMDIYSGGKVNIKKVR